MDILFVDKSRKDLKEQKNIELDNLIAFEEQPVFNETSYYESLRVQDIIFVSEQDPIFNEESHYLMNNDNSFEIVDDFIDSMDKNFINKDEIVDDLKEINVLLNGSLENFSNKVQTSLINEEFITPPAFEEYIVGCETGEIVEHLYESNVMKTLPIINVDEDIKLLVDDIDIEYLSFSDFDDELVELNYDQNQSIDISFDENLAEKLFDNVNDEQLTINELISNVENENISLNNNEFGDVQIIETTDFVQGKDYSDYFVTNVEQNIYQPVEVTLNNFDNNDDSLFENIEIINPGEYPVEIKNNQFLLDNSYKSNSNIQICPPKDIIVNYDSEIPIDSVTIRNNVSDNVKYESIISSNTNASIEEQIAKIKKGTNIFRRYYIASAANKIILNSLKKCESILSKKVMEH